MRKPRNTSQLRRATDKGETADKFPFLDPAAAPLGTDAEAAGRPPEASAVEQDAVAAASVVRTGRIPDSLGIPVYAAAAAAACIAVLAAVALA